MPKLLFSVLIICLLSACMPVGAPVVPSTGTSENGAADSDTAGQLTPDLTSTPAAPSKTSAQTDVLTAEVTLPPIEAAEIPVTVDEQAGYVEYNSGDLWLRLESPRDESEVSTSDINVMGQAPAETVISVNEEILLVGEDERFALPIRLEEGPNVIELVVSNPQGDVIELVLTVVYEKE